MTKKEKQYYDELKKRPNDPVFKMLFELDENGFAQPISGVTFKLMSDDVPFVMSTEMAKSFSNNFTISNSSLKSKIFSKSDNILDEIHNEIALDSPFGKKSIFYSPPKENFSLTKRYSLMNGIDKK